jgi:hypothetical protein
MSLVIDIDIQNDPFYLDGIEEGKIRLIENILISKTLPIKAIVLSTGITEEYILSIRKRLINEGRLKSNKRISDK